MRKNMERDKGNGEEYEKKQRKYSHKRIDVKEICKKKIFIIEHEGTQEVCKNKKSYLLIKTVVMFIDNDMFIILVVFVKHHF